MNEGSSRTTAHEPQRRCVGCGRRGAQACFIRLTLDRGVSPAMVVPATGKDHPGRGAYLCRRRFCLDKALQRKAFQRAFRESVTVDVKSITEMLDMGAPLGPDENDTAGG